MQFLAIRGTPQTIGNALCEHRPVAHAEENAG